MNLELHATAEEVMRAVEALQSFAKQNAVPDKIAFGLALALEESASNIVNHAYQRDAAQIFHAAFECEDDRFVIELRDHGPAFNPLEAAPPDFAGDRNTRELGGFGVHLIRHYIDDLHYAREGGENVLRLTKVIATDERTDP